ncbi:MAG: adenylosuccinate lyase [Bacteroidetes bacterium]|nr:adenylosuccinate lyase [Bacteroidota bacterium]
MDKSALTAVSPIDGRYQKQTKILQNYFSEFALMKYRVLVEIEYFIALCELPLPQLENIEFKEMVTKLVAIRNNFSLEDAQKIKTIEATTNHDVKAVEYFLREKFTEAGLANYLEFIHFGLTSQDINNTAVPLSIKEAIEEVYLPLLQKLKKKLDDLSDQWMSVAMLARTHGQPASPTKLGKEIKVFGERLMQQMYQLEVIPYSAKFGGATGNFNAHKVAYPHINWVEFGNNFTSVFGLQRTQYTTQIENYDNLAATCDGMQRINTICIDMCRDMWHYISIDYFKQKTKDGEVGSSAMPHKVNPIDFENAEGNLGIANALLHFFSSKLPISRLQRDLTDSTVLRNIGVPMAHTIIAFNSILKGLEKLVLNEKKLHDDLDANWAVCAEAIQTILRRENYPHPYEALKLLTRGKGHITQLSLHEFIDTLQVSEEIKVELKNISPFNYTGVF